MCLAIPGKIVSIDGDKAIIAYDDIKREAMMVGEYKVGDWVVVSSKLIVQKVSEEEALLAVKQWKEMLDGG